MNHFRGLSQLFSKISKYRVRASSFMWVFGRCVWVLDDDAKLKKSHRIWPPFLCPRYVMWEICVCEFPENDPRRNSLLPTSCEFSVLRVKTRMRVLSMRVSDLSFWTTLRLLKTRIKNSHAHPKTRICEFARTRYCIVAYCCFLWNNSETTWTNW